MIWHYDAVETGLVKLLCYSRFIILLFKYMCVHLLYYTICVLSKLSISNKYLHTFKKKKILIMSGYFSLVYSLYSAWYHNTILIYYNTTIIN